MDLVRANLEDCDGGKANQTGNTAFSLFQSYTRFADHQRPVRVTRTAGPAGETVEQARARSSAFGSYNSAKQRALNLVRTMADGMSTHPILDRSTFDMQPAGTETAVGVVEMVAEKPGDDFLKSLLSKVDIK